MTNEELKGRVFTLEILLMDLLGENEYEKRLQIAHDKMIIGRTPRTLMVNDNGITVRFE